MAITIITLVTCLNRVLKWSLMHTIFFPSSTPIEIKFNYNAEMPMDVERILSSVRSLIVYSYFIQTSYNPRANPAKRCPGISPGRGLPIPLGVGEVQSRCSWTMEIRFLSICMPWRHSHRSQYYGALSYWIVLIG